jgi:hypothetical protein
MAEDEEGTTEFRAGGLKDLLESQETAAKPAGARDNRRMAIIGGAGAAIVVVIAALVLAGGGGDDDGGNATGDDSGVPIGIEMRPAAAVGISPGKEISVCDSETGPVAEGVVLKEVNPAKSAAGQDIVQLVVLAEGAEINALGPTKAKSTWRAIGSETCPAVESTSTSETPTTLPPVQPPVSTPPDSAPTPPPSG